MCPAFQETVTSTATKISLEQWRLAVAAGLQMVRQPSGISSIHIMLRSTPSADMRPVLDGDILAFTLDWDARTLSCVNQRTKEAKEIADMECSQPLYPIVQFVKHGHSVKFLQENP